MDILLIDEQIKNKLNPINKRFYFLETSHIITKYKNLLSKPILRSNENKREKSDIIKEYFYLILKYYPNSSSINIEKLRSIKNKSDFIKEYQQMIKKKDPSKPILDEILYYEPESNKMICKNCNGIDFEKDEDFIACSECGYLTTRINFIFTPSDVGRVTPRTIYKLKKKKKK